MVTMELPVLHPQSVWELYKGWQQWKGTMWRSLTESPGLTWEMTSLNVVSNCSNALAHRSSYFSTNFSLCSVASAWILPFPWWLALLPWHSAHTVHEIAPTWAQDFSLEWPLATTSKLHAEVMHVPSVCELTVLGSVRRCGRGQRVAPRRDKQWVLNRTLPQCLLGKWNDH